MKITFICENENDETITIEKHYFPSADADELYDMFERFTHACGMSLLDLHEFEEQKTNTPVNADSVDTVKSKPWSWMVEQLKNNHDWDWKKNQNEIDHIEAPSHQFGSKEYCSVCGLKTEIMEREMCYDTYCPKNENANKR